MDAFATVQQLEAFWRTLTAPEKTRAETMLGLVSNRLRQIGRNVGVDLDAEKSDPVFNSNLQLVTMESTKRAMQTPIDQAPVDSFSQTAGPYSENYKYTNPSGDIWFKKAELQSLNIYGKQSLKGFSTSQKDIYS